LRALRKGQARPWCLQPGIRCEVRLVERAFGIWPSALTEAMGMLNHHFSSPASSAPSDSLPLTASSLCNFSPFSISPFSLSPPLFPYPFPFLIFLFFFYHF